MRSCTSAARTGGTLSSSRTRPIAAITETSTATPAICAAPCPMLHSSPSPALPSGRRTATPGRCSAPISTRTTCGARWRTTPPCPWFQPRLIQLARLADLDDDAIDDAAEEATTGLDEVDKQRLQQSVAVLEALYGAPERLHTLAADFVEHWERRRENLQSAIKGPGQGQDRYRHPLHRRPAVRGDWRGLAPDGLRLGREGGRSRSSTRRILRTTSRSRRTRAARRRSPPSSSGSRTPATSSRSSSSRT